MARPAASACSSCARFEMPPHARMSLVQQLLLRALVARFWDKPYTHARSRAGAPSCTTASCCRTFVADGFRRRASPRLQRGRLRRSTPRGSRRTSSSASRWSARSQSSGVELTLRNALEPWHVMGEEGAAGGTVRYVDSSLERLEVQRHRPERQPPCGHRQRPCRCRCSRPAASASSSPACATARGRRRRRCIRRSACTRRSRSTSSTPG